MIERLTASRLATTVPACNPQLQKVRTALPFPPLQIVRAPCTPLPAAPSTRARSHREPQRDRRPGRASIPAPALQTPDTGIADCRQSNYIPIQTFHMALLA